MKLQESEGKRLDLKSELKKQQGKQRQLDKKYNADLEAQKKSLQQNYKMQLDVQ